MRNVVSKFIGKNEKELNEDLVKMSIYYSFDINVTNAFSGNEKGYVEGSVKYLRNKIFAENYKFPSEDSVIEYMESRLMKLNENSKIEEEKRNLKPTKPPLELANIRKSLVNKYSFVQIENNFYSVPEYLVGLNVTSKIYYNKILIYSNNEFVCEHKKIDGVKKISADIRHYLKTLTFKPEALKNSYVLKSNPKLKSIFDKYYTNNPKKFIEVISNNKEENINKTINISLCTLLKNSNNIYGFNPNIATNIFFFVILYIKNKLPTKIINVANLKIYNAAVIFPKDKDVNVLHIILHAGPYITGSFLQHLATFPNIWSGPFLSHTCCTDV